MKFKSIALTLLTFSLVAACDVNQPESNSATIAPEGTTNQSDVADSAETALNAVADKLYQHTLAIDPAVRYQAGLPITQWFVNTEESSRKNAQFARGVLTDLEQIDVERLNHDQKIFAEMIRYNMEVQLESEKYFWYGFEVTPYQAGFKIPKVINSYLANYQLDTPELRENYLALVSDYARWLNDVVARLKGQAERGILLPKPAIPGVIATWETYREAIGQAVQIEGDRAASVEDDGSFRLEVDRRLTSDLLPAVDALIATFDSQYIERAPQRVGQAAYPNGKEYYRHMIKLYGGPQYTPEHMHELGLKLMDQLREERAAVRAQLGFEGSEREFHEMLRTDSRFKASSPAEVEKRYMEYMARIEPHVDQFFNVKPKAPYGVKRASPAVEKGMTYGYYQRPTPNDERGYYVYNGSSLDKRTLITAQHLIYHELVPGHHFHIALEQENSSWHPVRQLTGASAFAEGWAEYAAALAEDMQLYSDPYDYYGHLLMQSFLSSRVVVDTGMNYLGWSLEKARQYMTDNTFESDLQIATETIRYATDLPAQALAYRLVRQRMQELRTHAMEALGDKFDIRGFHDVLLTNGSLPMSVLEKHVEWYIAQHR